MKAEPSSVEEVVPNMAYGQPHNVRKYPSHLAQNQQDSFEYPYARQKQQNYPQMPPVGYPQYPQGYPQYQPNYGKKRRKRKASSSKYEQFDAHSGIHRIMSTGMNLAHAFLDISLLEVLQLALHYSLQTIIHTKIIKLYEL